ncbi:BRR6 [Hepatospora eriocheir]|uniref:BRR6 n=1 Tax=Hepatospora eriocheir TaxID=1081669 RepID=A0A1X0QAP8_9MICR|nr:BRR6 [Hepatospora eriocheir]
MKSDFKGLIEEVPNFKWNDLNKKVKCKQNTLLDKFNKNIKENKEIKVIEEIKEIKEIKEESKDLVLYKNNNLRIIKKIYFDPLIIIPYIYLVFHTIIISVLLYLILHLLIFFRKDILGKILIRRSELEDKISSAKHNYEINRCDPLTRVPAINDLCNEWDRTIKAQLNVMNYTVMVLELFGECFNGFINKISYYGLFVCIIISLLVIKYKK